MSMEWIAPLAASGSAALVAAAATDTWLGARARFASFLSRGSTAAAPAETLLDELNTAITNLPEGAPREAERLRRRIVWHQLLATTLIEHPEAEGELRALLADMGTPAGGTRIEQHNTADGSGTVNAVGYGSQIIHHHGHSPQ